MGIIPSERRCVYRCVCVCEIALDCTGITVPFLFLFFLPIFFFFLFPVYVFYITVTYIIKTLHVRVYYYRPAESSEDPNAPDTLTKRVSVLFLYIHFPSRLTWDTISYRDGVDSRKKSVRRVHNDVIGSVLYNTIIYYICREMSFCFTGLFLLSTDAV